MSAASKEYRRCGNGQVDPLCCPGDGLLIGSGERALICNSTTLDSFPTMGRWEDCFGGVGAHLGAFVSISLRCDASVAMMKYAVILLFFCFGG